MNNIAVSEAEKAVVRRIPKRNRQVQGKGNFDVFEELFAEDFVDHTPQPNTTPCEFRTARSPTTGVSAICCLLCNKSAGGFRRSSSLNSGKKEEESQRCRSVSTVSERSSLTLRAGSLSARSSVCRIYSVLDCAANCFLGKLDYLSALLDWYSLNLLRDQVHEDKIRSPSP